MPKSVHPELAVALFCHSSRGGSTRVAVELAAALAEREHDVHVFTLSPLTLWPSRPTRLRIHAARPCTEPHRDASRLHMRWTSNDCSRFLRCFAETHEQTPFDILHFHYGLPFAALAAALRDSSLRRLPTIVGTLHGTDVSHFGVEPVDVRALVRDLRRADVLTTVSRAHARLAVDRLGLARSPEVIPNFVDTSRFRPRERGARPPGRPLRLVHLSNFRAVKNPLDLIRVFAGVRRTREAELWLVGDGEGVSLVQERARSERIADSVHHVPCTADLPSVLAAADLFLCTSHEESFCLAALEAMACGVPVVAPRVGGLPELVVDGKTGHLYEAGDVEGAAGAIRRLADDHERHLALRSAARRRALEFERDATIGRYETLYRRAMIRSRRRARAWIPSPVRAHEAPR